MKKETVAVMEGHIHTWFSVKVPVLSLQIVVAEPIVSHAESLRTYI